MTKHSPTERLRQWQRLHANTLHPLIDLTPVVVIATQQVRSCPCLSQVLDDRSSLSQQSAIFELEDWIGQCEACWELLGETLLQI